MKHPLALGLLISLLLTSCSVDWNDVKEKKIGELEKQVMEMKKDKEDDLFKKKQECAKYKDNVMKTSDGGNLQELFYSPERHSCIMLLSVFPEDKILFTQLKDYLTGETILDNYNYNCKYTSTDTEDYKKQCPKDAEKFSNKIEELKGE
ncbi:MAG: hypothetical protein PHH16_02260 [Candidatus Gracilibacteria bacterium]|nr:hypothetical protein [Candidatus Gracilibacteria bacterium]